MPTKIHATSRFGPARRPLWYVAALLTTHPILSICPHHVIVCSDESDTKSPTELYPAYVAQPDRIPASASICRLQPTEVHSQKKDAPLSKAGSLPRVLPSQYVEMDVRYIAMAYA